MSTIFDFKEHVDAQALAYVRKESLDIYNRLQSVLEDVKFVNQVHEAYPELPILRTYVWFCSLGRGMNGAHAANLRCGAWYIDPASIGTPEGAYFKSTDGHFGNWSFNLRRPNLHLLPLVVDGQGVVLVDSTRAGKRIPDGLSKTVPIWCAVINRAMFLLHPDKKDWDLELYCPPGAVSEQERGQIKANLDAWAESLVKSSYFLPTLDRPLRPLWITPATSVFPHLRAQGELKYLPIICVSASKQVHDGLERRSNGFSYVQGSGDDHELWGMGLTPQLFWEKKDILLGSSREDLASVVAAVVAAQSKASQHHDSWRTSPTSVAMVNDQLLIGSAADMPAGLPPSLPGVDGNVSFVVISPCTVADLVEPNEEAQEPDANRTSRDHHVLHLKLSEGKKDQIHFLQAVLPASTAYIKDRLARGDAVCICCATGKDASVGIALAVLSMFFDDKGRLVKEGVQPVSPNKQSIRTRLQWIISSRPQANPSRVTLKRVNEYLLSSSSFRRTGRRG